MICIAFVIPVTAVSCISWERVHPTWAGLDSNIGYRRHKRYNTDGTVPRWHPHHTNNNGTTSQRDCRVAAEHPTDTAATTNHSDDISASATTTWGSCWTSQSLELWLYHGYSFATHLSTPHWTSSYVGTNVTLFSLQLQNQTLMATNPASVSPSPVTATIVQQAAAPNQQQPQTVQIQQTNAQVREKELPVYVIIRKYLRTSGKSSRDT